MFYRFVGGDKVQNFQLSKILFFDNQKLEKNFREFFIKLTKESMKQHSQSKIVVKPEPKEVAKPAPQYSQSVVTPKPLICR